MQVSLLIPAYQAERFLPDILGDAKAQRPGFHEILVYDDASKDKTTAVAQALGATVITGPSNRGVSYARNRLLDAASAPWIHFHDADDRMDHAYLETMQRLAPAPDEIIICGMKTYDSATQRFGTEYDSVQLDRCTDLGVYLRTHFQMGSGLYPAQLLKSLGGFREELRGAEDHEFHIRMFLAGAKFRAIPDRLNTYCRHGGITFTESQQERLNADWLKVFKEYQKILPQRYAPLLADMIMEHAYKLYAGRQYALANEAVALATGAGQRTVVSSSRWMKGISSVIGVKPVFFLRSLKSRFERLQNK